MRLTYFKLFMCLVATSIAWMPAAAAPTRTPNATRWIVLLTEKPVAEQYPGRIERIRDTAAPYRLHLQQVQAGLRPQIEGMHVRVTGALQHLLNGIFVVATPAQAATLRRLPGVKAVVPMVQFRKADQLSMSNVQAAWNASGIGGQSNAGAGIKIGIIDTGIDNTHPAFQDSSLPTPSGPVTYPVCNVPPSDCPTLPSQCAYTNNKIIVARSYVCEIVDSDVSPVAPNTAAQSRPDDLSARDLDGHGTGVASVAAGVQTTYNGTTISGVAPKAYLGNYKIFGSDDTNPNGIGNIYQALEDAVTDGMDVVNLSSGSPAYFSGPLDTDSTSCVNSGLPNSPIPIPSDACDAFAYEVENAMDNALVTVVVAAGNQGDLGYQFNFGCGSPPCDNYSAPTFSTISSPAYAPSAIAVGGIQNDVTYVQQVEVSGLAPIDAYESYDGPPPDAPLTAPLANATSTGNSLCSAAGPTTFSDEIVLVEQGTCPDVTMVTNAQTAGAVGVIEIADSSQVEVFPYGLSGTFIPTFIVGQTDGATLQSYAASSSSAAATMDPKPYQVTATSQGFAPYSVASFSSRGPVNETGALKPDLVAVATDFLIPTQSYDPEGELFNFAGYGTTQGTSFATPMVAGSAALVKQANPNLTPLQIKSALVNSAVLTNLTTSDTSAQASVTEVGAGLLQTQNAVKSTVQVVPSSVSFGMTGVSLVTSVPLTVYNTSASPVTLTASVVQSAGYSNATDQVSVSPSTLNIPANSNTNVTVNLTGGSPAPGRYEGVIQLSGGPVPLAVPYMYIAGYTAGNGVPYDVIPLNATQPGQGYVAFDGAQGAYLPWWYAPCENLNNSCVNDYGPVAVQVVDQYGAPVANFPVTWGVTAGSGLIDEANSDSVTNQNGIAGAAVYLGAAGPQEFAVDVNGMILPFDGYARVPPVINTGGVVDAASFTVGRAVAPGSWISVFGQNLTDTTQGYNGVNEAFANCGACNVVNQALPMGIDGAAFSFDNSSQSLPGRLNYVSPVQINLQVPWELTGSSAIVKVIVNYTYSAEYTLPLATYSPGFFVIDLANDVAALDQNYQLVDSSNPVARGSYVQLYLNGLGPVTNQPGDGLAAPSNPNALAQTMATPTITIGGQAAPGSFSGLAPGFVSLYQVNVQVPTGISAGAQPITCSIGGVSAKTSQLYVK